MKITCQPCEDPQGHQYDDDRTCFLYGWDGPWATIGDPCIWCDHEKCQACPPPRGRSFTEEHDDGLELCWQETCALCGGAARAANERIRQAYPQGNAASPSASYERSEAAASLACDHKSRTDWCGECGAYRPGRRVQFLEVPTMPNRLASYACCGHCGNPHIERRDGQTGHPIPCGQFDCERGKVPFHAQGASDV